MPLWVHVIDRNEPMQTRTVQYMYGAVHVLMIFFYDMCAV